MKFKKIAALLLAVVIVISVALISSLSASADLVVIEKSEEKMPLEYINLAAKGGITGGGNTIWPTKGELTQADGKYTITNN